MRGNYQKYRVSYLFFWHLIIVHFYMYFKKYKSHINLLFSFTQTQIFYEINTRNLFIKSYIALKEQYKTHNRHCHWRKH